MLVAITSRHGWSKKRNYRKKYYRNMDRIIGLLEDLKYLFKKKPKNGKEMKNDRDKKY